MSLYLYKKNDKRRKHPQIVVADAETGDVYTAHYATGQYDSSGKGELVNSVYHKRLAIYFEQSSRRLSPAEIQAQIDRNELNEVEIRNVVRGYGAHYQKPLELPAHPAKKPERAAARAAPAAR